MKLRTTKLTSLILAGVIGVALFVGWLYIGLQRVAWIDYADSAIHHLAVFVESYNGLHDKYPDSLDEMLKDPAFGTNSAFSVLAKGDGGVGFSYKLSNDSFVIVGTNNWSRLIGAQKLEKRFSRGEVLR